ncbi:hypothetical protein [Undibacterium sp. Ji22W]|uniref:hypothetical protein n=1 Tax=Undibacterium sp. Ji22W TaxID=3413038 RepID=UPI003BF1A6C9
MYKVFFRKISLCINERNPLSTQTADLPGILALQSRNPLINLNEAEQKNGFVTTALTVAQIEALLGNGGVFVSVEMSAHEQSETVIGYAFAGSWAFSAQWPIFRLWWRVCLLYILKGGRLWK